MIEIYGATTATLPSEEALLALSKNDFYGAWMDMHHAPENRQVLRMGLGGLWLLQQAGVDGHLCYDPNGRPYLDGQMLDFNITHTDRAVFCALARNEQDGRVGLDAERVDRVSTLRSMALAQRWFAGEECRIFAKAPIPEAFLSIWTRKEALVKWTGEGMRALRSEDTTTAETRYGVRFCDYRVGDTVVTLCHRADSTVPCSIQMM